MEHAPGARREPLDEQQLHGAPAFALAAPEPSREYPGGVDDKEVATLEHERKVAERAVLDFAGGALDRHQAARRAVGERLLRDELRRQHVVEGVRSHLRGGSVFWYRSFSLYTHPQYDCL